MIRQFLLLAVLLLPVTTFAQNAKYFGYFAGDTDSAAAANPGGPGFEEMKDHINLYAISNWSTDTTPAGKASSQAYVLSELAKARAAHVHAIVPAYPFVFQAVKNSAGNVSCWNNDPTAAASWASLTQAMVDQGYLVPGDPGRSTVVATYIVDEPNGDVCLSDSGGQANPGFVNAVTAIRQDPRTTTLPIASILAGKGFDKFFAGMKLLDWVGFDEYGDDDGKWARTLSALKQYAPGKKYIVVPGAMQGCDQVEVDDTARFSQAIESDASVIWEAPFAWFSGLNNNASCKGVRDIPELRSDYTKEGLKIKDLQCNSSFKEKEYCGLIKDITPSLQLLLND